jgi:hypothetical protein
MKRIVFSLLLACCLTSPLISVEGRYKELTERPPHLEGHQYKAILLVEKIKEGQRHAAPKVGTLRVMLEVELDRLEDREQWCMEGCKTSIEELKQKLVSATTDEEKRRLQESIDVQERCTRIYEKNLETINSFRKYTVTPRSPNEISGHSG